LRGLPARLALGLAPLARLASLRASLLASKSALALPLLTEVPAAFGAQPCDNPV